MPPHPRLRCLLPVLLVGAAVPALGAAVPAPASASSTYHCEGYTPCAAAGMTSSGYASRNDSMYWRMYSGHNCTNYVAYRMIKAGMSTERPWSGSGMAYNWGFAMSSITDTTPRVGAVAWWNRGVAGAGSSGHVAVVEQVVSATEIVISEDSWNGDFDWRTIVKDGPGWPSGFIHFVDKSITNTRAPQVLGTPQVGEALTAQTGAYQPGTVAKQVQWLADGVPIDGATAGTLTLGPAQVGAAIAARVSATKKGYTTAVVDSPATAAVAPGVLTNVAVPAVSGNPEVDQVLTATPGAWTPTPDLAGIRWKADGVVIAGASGPTLALTPALVGKTITVAEAARRDGYTKGTVDSVTAVGPVVQGIVEVAEPFTVSGRNRYGDQLVVTPGRVTPSDASLDYAWLRDGEAISGAAGTTYAPTAADIGHDVSLRVTATKPRYQALVRTFELATTTTPSATAVTVTSKRKRQVAVGVRVHAGGLGAADGPVTVTVGTHRVTGQAVAGSVRLVLNGLAPGTRRVVVTYDGLGAIEPSSVSTTVKVKR